MPTCPSALPASDATISLPAATPPLDSFQPVREETGTYNTAATLLARGFAVFPLVKIDVTNTEVASNSDAMMVPQPTEWTAPD